MLNNELQVFILQRSGDKLSGIEQSLQASSLKKQTEIPAGFFANTKHLSVFKTLILIMILVST